MSGLDRARLDAMLVYVNADPANPRLLADAAQAAIDACDFDEAAKLIAQLHAAEPGGFDQAYLAGLLAMYRGDFTQACTAFTTAGTVSDVANPNLSFSLAWSLAMVGNKPDAIALLDAAVLVAIPAAAMLKTQLLHEAGALDEAMAVAREGLAHFPQDAGLLGVVATLAIDTGDLVLARRCADASGDHPEGLAAAGVLDLREGNAVLARARFDASLAARQHNPRAWIGRGLVDLTERNPVAAAAHLDRGAEQFARHIGSWIAAGWAHYLAGDIAAAQQRFERALAIDQNFAESHGSLAVIDVAQGNLDAARRRMVTAFRLNPNCFSAALAKVMLSSDNPQQAQAIVERAMNTPIGDDGLTLATYMAGMARPTVH